MTDIFLGIHKTTLIDYPAEVATILFTGGCNFLCPYCHNPELVNIGDNPNWINMDYIFEHIKKRKNLLGGVVISGGEPLIHTGIIDIISRIKSIGLKVKIDTNGSMPETLKMLDVDYIAMDIKTVLSGYGKFCTVLKDIETRINDSIKYIINSGIDHEFRTTVVPGIIGEKEITNISAMLKGAKRVYLNRFKPSKTLDPAYMDVKPYSEEELDHFRRIIFDNGIPCKVR